MLTNKIFNASALYAEKVEIDEHWIHKIERVLEEIRK